MDAVGDVMTLPAPSATNTNIQESSNGFNVNQSSNTGTHSHANTPSGSISLANKSTSNISSTSTISGSSHASSSNSNSSCSSSSTSSNSSGYGSSTTTPTNNYDLQQTTPTATPIPTTPVANTEHAIPVATVAAVAPFYNESITTDNFQTHHVQHHHHYSQQQQQQQQQHHFLQTTYHQHSQNHLQTNLQQQHHQYLPKQQYYSPYDYQTAAPAHNLSGGNATPMVSPYNMIVPGPYEMSASNINPSYGPGPYKSSNLTGVANYERNSVVKANVATPTYSQPQQQGEQQQSKTADHQTQHFTGSLSSSKQRSSSLTSSTTNTNTSKPQATATPFYANPTPFYDNFKHKIPLEYHDTYSNTSTATAASYHQQQKYYAAAKSQLKEASYGPPAPLNSKSLYANNFFPTPTAGLNISSTPYDKYLYSHTSATGYATSGHLGNETPPEVSNYRKPVVGNTMNSSSWPWGIDYVSGNSRSIPPPSGHIPTATVAPTHATHLTQNPSVLVRDSYYTGHDKYSVKYDNYCAPSYQQPYLSSPANRHIWPNTPHASNLTQLNDRHLLTTVPPALPSHGIHTTPYFPNSSTTSLNSRQSCCSQPHQPQSCYYPASHTVPTRLPHSQTSSLAQATGGYLAPQQALGQSPHLNALSASCKYSGVLSDYGNGNKIKNSNDLYLNSHHYDNSPASHNFGYGSAHNSQTYYNTNAHQTMAHGSAPASLLTNDSLSANPTSYTNDLNLTTSNFDSYHPHYDIHPNQQPLGEMHNPPQPPPAYGPTVAKRALLDYRKPAQPQPPPTTAENCYTTLTSRDHYSQQELLNTPETTTTFGEYEAQQSNTSALSTEILADSDRSRDESNKNLSLRDFIANWNDDEDEYQNNEEINFDQDTVIDEVLQAAPVEQETAAIPVAAAIEEPKVARSPSLDTKGDAALEKTVKAVENLAATLNDLEANQYVNLPDIVIDIEKSSNINNSITTPSISPTSPILLGPTNTTLNLSNFDVEKELDELKLKKPAQKELRKEGNDLKDTKSITTPLLSPCKNLTTQLSFEDLNLEPTNKTVLNAVTTRLTTHHSSELNEQYFKDIEGYESSSSRHSNESAFEKEYETFINKITSETCKNKSENAKSATDAENAEKDIDFEKNVHDFSKFYKRKRKLKEDELKSNAAANQREKKLKVTDAKKVNNSNFPQVYTKKCRNRLNKIPQHTTLKRKPLSAYYKIIHSIRRFGLFREKRVRAYMAELKEKHLPLIKRQSMKNYTHDKTGSFCNAESLKTLCIIAINTEEFRQILAQTDARNHYTQTEKKHICSDPTCDTCEVIKSLMAAEPFDVSLMQPPIENINEAINFSSVIYCVEGNSETITILEDTPNNITISSGIDNVGNFPTVEVKDPEDLKSLLHENVVLENWSTISQAPTNPEFSAKDSSTIVSLQPSVETEININSVEVCKSKTLDADIRAERLSEVNTDAAYFETDKNLIERSQTPNLDAQAHETVLSKNFKEVGLRDEKLSGILEAPIPDCFTIEKPLSCAKDKPSVFCELNEVERIYAEDSKDVENMKNAKLMAAEVITTSSLENENLPETNKQNETSESDSTDSYDSDTDRGSSDTDDSTDSHKKSDSNNGSSDADTEEDINNEEEIVNSDSNQSCCLQEKKLNATSSNAKRKKILKAHIFNKKQILSPESGKKEKKNLRKTDMVSSVNIGRDSENENVSKSPQRIVIRITKSLSPNDQSLRVESVFGKSLKVQSEIDNQPDADIEIKKSEIISNHSKDLGCDNSTNELEDNSYTEKKSPPLKLVLRIPDFSKEQAAEYNEVDNYTSSESDNDDSFHHNSEVNTTLNLNHNLERDIDECEYDKTTKTQIEGELRDDSSSDKITISTKSSPKEDICERNINCETEMISITGRNGTDKHKIFEKPLEFSEITSGTKEAVEKISSFLKLFSNTENSFDDCAIKEPLQCKNEKELRKDIIPGNYLESEFLDKEDEMIITHSKQKSKDVKENNEFFEGEDVIENPFNNLSPKSVEFNTFSKDSIKEHTSQNSTGILNKAENNTEKETFPEDDQLESGSECEATQEIENEKFDFTKKPPLATIEFYNLTSSESEGEYEEFDKQPPSPCKESDFSDYESSYHSEYESDCNDETLEPIKKFNNLEPIVISDDESIYTGGPKEKLNPPIKSLRKTSQDFLQQLAITSELHNSKEEQKSSTDGEDDKHQDNKNFKVTQIVENEENFLALTNEDSYSESESSSAKKISKINQENNIKSDIVNISEHSDNADSFNEKIHDKTIDHKREKEVQDLQPKLKKQSVTTIEQNYNVARPNTEDIPLECSAKPKNLEDRSEIDSSKEYENIVKPSDCEASTDQSSHEIYLPTEEVILKNSEIKMSDGLNTPSKNSETSKFIPEDIETVKELSTSEETLVEEIGEEDAAKQAYDPQKSSIKDPECKCTNSKMIEKIESIDDNLDKEDFLSSSREVLPLEQNINRTVPDTCEVSFIDHDAQIKDLNKSEIHFNVNVSLGSSMENQTVENDFVQSTVDDKTNRFKEVIMPQDPCSPLNEACNSLSQNMEQDNFKEKSITSEKIQIMDENSIVGPEEDISMDLEEKSEPEKKIKTTCGIISGVSEITDNFLTEDTIAESNIDEAETAIIFESPTETTEDSEKVYIENTNMSDVINGDCEGSLNENNTEINYEASESIFEAIVNMAKDSNEELLDQMSSNKTKVSEKDMAEEKTNSSDATNSNEIIENIMENEAESSEAFEQVVAENTDDLENVSERQIINEDTENAEIMSDHDTHIHEPETELDGKHMQKHFSETETKQNISEKMEEISRSPEKLEVNPAEFYNKINLLETVEEEKFVAKDNLETRLPDIKENVQHNPEEVSQQIESFIESQIENTTQEEEIESLNLKEQLFVSTNEHCNEEIRKGGHVFLDCSGSSEIPNSSKEQLSNKLANVFEPKNSINLQAINESIVGNENLHQDTEEVILHDTETSKENSHLLDEKSEHQTDNSNPSCNKTDFLKDHVESGVLFTLKNQSSFEDESGDFLGFEDLEEVARVRREIENLNDDSTANDGFLNNQTLNKEMHKSSTNSLTESTSSEINELEALEKELSQHQSEMQVNDMNRETEIDLPMKTNKAVSTNDIEHIKQMLESDEEQPIDVEDKIEKLAHKDKSVENITINDILSSVNSIIPKLSDLCRAALNSSLNSNSNLAQQHTETSTILLERELSVEEALAEMYRQAGVLLSDPEDCDNDIPSPGNNEAHDVLLINLQEILNSDNNDIYLLQCDMNENVLNVVQSTENHEEERQGVDTVNTERVNTVQIILDTENSEPQIHIISSDSESEVILLSDDESDFSYRPFATRPERVAIPFINDDEYMSDIEIPTIHHEEIVPDNLNKFLQEEFYKYLHEKYVQRNISKYYHANRVLKKYKKRYFRTNRQ